MSFQNMGTTNAGVIASSAGPINNVFAMDAAGVASGNAFLTSELEKRDTLIRKPLTLHIPVTSSSRRAAAGSIMSPPSPWPMA